ncbi:MAG: OmpA family protein [Saprospiraceae bacterium]|nr:OmpA family protein [Candidatus Vicinibacter affinis]
MKQFLYSLILLACLAGPVNAQLFELKQGLSAKKTLVDYNTLRDKDAAALKDMGDGFELAYLRRFSKNFVLSAPLGLGRYVDSLGDGGGSPLFSVGVLGQYHFFKSSWWVNPFLTGGLNSLFPMGRSFGIEIPLGLGLNVKLHPQVFLQVQSDYRLGIIDWEDHLQHTFGLVYFLGNKKAEKPVMEMQKTDSDGDGIADELDLCPSIAGLAKFYGCPDTDGDGIEDSKDKCPDTAGVAALDGCPDADGDGVSDNDDECPNVKGLIENKGCPEKDGDGDGIPDKEDHCPDKAGLASLYGCPDSDGDGVSDKDDRCPDIPGLKTKGGCPETKKDSDKDGIEDDMDECPFAAGLMQFKGCPDTDGDGIQDKVDDCPTMAGPRSNKGCPLIEKKDLEVLDFAMRAIQFDLGRATLKEESFSILDKIAKILKKYPDYNLAIGGHTDNSGSPGFNLELSEKRAKVCYGYLVSKGLDQNRLSYTGYGITKPIADNKTETGRFLNRRTEFNLVPK